MDDSQVPTAILGAYRLFTDDSQVVKATLVEQDGTIGLVLVGKNHFGNLVFCPICWRDKDGKPH